MVTIFKKQRKSEAQKRLDTILDEIGDVSRRISDLESCFNELDDDDYSEALIYEQIAYQKRLNKLLKEAKEIERKECAQKIF